jgi:hypothetical protein
VEFRHRSRAAYCKDFVEKNKGKVTLESRLERGTKVTMQFPLQKQNKMNKILVIDNEINLRETLCGPLTQTNTSSMKQKTESIELKMFNNFDQSS